MLDAGGSLGVSSENRIFESTKCLSSSYSLGLPVIRRDILQIPLMTFLAGRRLRALLGCALLVLGLISCSSSPDFKVTDSVDAGGDNPDAGTPSSCSDNLRNSSETD